MQNYIESKIKLSAVIVDSLNLRYFYLTFFFSKSYKVTSFQVIVKILLDFLSVFDTIHPLEISLILLLSCSYPLDYTQTNEEIRLSFILVHRGRYVFRNTCSVRIGLGAKSTQSSLPHSGGEQGPKQAGDQRAFERRRLTYCEVNSLGRILL